MVLGGDVQYEKGIAKSKADIQSSTSGLSVNGANQGQPGSETRPKNMVVEWIIRVF